MKSKVGDRVGAILSANKDEVKFLGYGVYVGNEIPSENCVGFLSKSLINNGIANPKILLDSGKYVFGCECWWGSEDKVRDAIDGRKIVDVDIDEIRNEHTKRAKNG